MRFATIMLNNAPFASIYHNGSYYLFRDLFKGFEGDAPGTVLDFIRICENKPLPDFPAIIKNKNIAPVDIDARDVKLYAPIPEPFRNIICLGKNYADHAKEVLQTKLETQNENYIPSAPVYFTKNANPAMGNGDVISLHENFTKQVDYEVELGVVIGKTIKSEPAENIENAIFGYTIINDVTARDIQTAYGQWYFGKSLDGFCPMGPHIVTKDEIPFPVNVNVSCRVNGELRQSSNTSMLIYGISRIVSELSRGMTLYPGDIIATGTPGGIGHAKNPPAYLKKGDAVECEIEKIGVLCNIFD